MQCRVCESEGLVEVLDLGLQPWCNHFLRIEEIGTEPTYPLRVVFCEHCHTAQLDYTVKKEIMFGDHTYLSGVTQSLSAHFKAVAREVDVAVGTRQGTKSVLDIGSNDGTQLKHFQALGYKVLGIESSKTTAKIAVDAGVPTENCFFDLSTAKRLRQKFDVVNAAGVFFHLEELHDVTEGIRHCLQDNGIFCVQFLYMKRIIENLAFDQIYHEHLLYYNLENIETLLGRHGLAMYDCYLSPIHGGSIVGFVGHAGGKVPTARLLEMRHDESLARANDLSTYFDFAKRVAKMKEINLAFLESRKAAGKRIYGMGAPVKGNTLLNYFGVGRQFLDCLVEKNPLRNGLYSPGMHLPVVMESELTEPPDVYYVLAWNFKDEILRNNQHLLSKGVEFFFPVNAN